MSFANKKFNNNNDDDDDNDNDNDVAEFGLESSGGGGATSELSNISTSSVMASASQPLDVSELLRETAGVTNRRATELIQLDAGNLTVYNTQEFEPHSIADAEIDATIQQRATDAVQVLFNELFRLPVERAINGAVVSLPKIVTRYPREKPLPQPKPETRWEKFAKIKGIKHTKKSKWDWDEAKQEWRPRSGYQKANDPMGAWVIEDTQRQSEKDPSFDPFSAMEKEKRDKKRKQGEREQRNLNEGAKTLAAAAAKSKRGVKVPRQRFGATISLDADPMKFDRSTRKAELAEVSNTAAQSTASMGIFDQKLKKLGEKNIRGKRKRFEPVIAANSGDERDRYLKMMKRVVTPTNDAAVDIDKAAKQQRQIDHKVGKRRDIAAKPVRDTLRRRKQGELRRPAAAGAAKPKKAFAKK